MESRADEIGGGMESLKLFGRFVADSGKAVTRGSKPYFVWMALLAVLIAVGTFAYVDQLSSGLITSNMRDQVSWGFYIGNFAFLVGVAAAAVVLVVPAYVYNWGPIREVVLVAEMLSVAAIIMCILFVTVDVGRPGIIWHMAPGVGTPNFPHSMLVWDVLVLSSYFLINYFIVTYLMFKGYAGQPYNAALIMPIVFLSIPMAIGIHTVTAMLFLGVKARAFWHTAILAPRFLSSAFCSGPALMVLIFLVLRHLRRLRISDEAILKIGELLAYAMALNLFLLGVEVFAEFYSPTSHTVHAEVQWGGVHGGSHIAVYTWLALACNLVALVGFIVPTFRHRTPMLAGACVLAVAGVYVEKGLALVIPGLTPDALGEIYHYFPSATEFMVGIGIWSLGALLFTLMVKVGLAVGAGGLERRSA
jgi:molybdopterin-containing oxidoreductase family membrane subunit